MDVGVGLRFDVGLLDSFDCAGVAKSKVFPYNSAKCACSFASNSASGLELEEEGDCDREFDRECEGEE